MAWNLQYTPWPGLQLGVMNTTTADSTTASATNTASYRFIAPTNAAITNIYLYYTTASVTGSQTITVRTWDGTGGSAGHHDGAALTNGALTADNSGNTTSNQWSNFAFTNMAATVAGTGYYISVEHSGGTGIVHQHSSVLQTLAFSSTVASIMTPLVVYAGTAGVSDVHTINNSEAPLIVIKWADGTLLGCPYASTASSANNTNDKGLFIPTLDANYILHGVAWSGADTDIDNVKIYKNALTDADATYSVAGLPPADSIGYTTFGTPYTMQKGNAYRVTLSGAAGFQLNCVTMGQTSGTLPADVRTCNTFGVLDSGCYTELSGGAWTNSAGTSGFTQPRMLLFLRRAEASGGGGTPSLSGNFQ